MKGGKTVLDTVLIGILVVLLVGVIGLGGWYLGHEKGSSDMKAYYEKVVSDQKTFYEEALTDLKAEHEEEIADLQTTQEKALADLKAEHEEEIVDLQTTQEKALADLEAKYEQEITNLKAAHEKALAKAKKDSYNEGYKKGQASVDYLYDPTYEEMQNFLEDDATGDPEDLSIVYNKPYYADQVRTRAQNKDIRSYIVLVRFTSGQYHVIVAFDTVDEGRIYVEPQNDHEVTLTAGESYSEQNEFTIKPNDVIQDFTVFD